MRHEGYDQTEVATFLGAVASELRSVQMRLELLEDTVPAGTRIPTSPVLGINEVSAALPPDGAPLESQITLDALQDAQADLVARVRSTAQGLHESLESGGRMMSPNHLRSNAASGAIPAPPPPVTSPAPAPLHPPAPVQPAPTVEASPLAGIDLAADPLEDARNALDNVLDDVMGSIRPD